MSTPFTLLLVVLSLFPCMLATSGNVGHQLQDFDDGDWSDANDVDGPKFHGHPKHVFDYNVADQQSSTSSSNQDAHESPFAFRVTVKRLHTCPNAMVVLTSAVDSRTSSLRYAVVYWPKALRGNWKQRFSGSVASSRYGKQLIPIDGLLGSAEYVVKVTALLRDSSTHEETAFYTTPKNCGLTENPTVSPTCYPSITTRRRLSETAMYIKWTNTCDASLFSGYAVRYTTRIDYRQTYVDIQQDNIVFEGMVDFPDDDNVSVEAVSLSLTFGPLALTTVYPTIFSSESSGDSSCLCSSVTAPTVSRASPQLFGALNADSRPPMSTPMATVQMSTPMATVQMSSDALLISVVVLAILFVCSALVALYLCFYLRMHKHKLSSSGHQTTADQSTSNEAQEILSLDIKRESNETSLHQQETECVSVDTPL